MKHWLAQFQPTDDLNRKLRGGPPPVEPPPSLHGGIMAAIRASETVPTRNQARGYGWAVAGALVVLLIAGLWGATHLVVSRLTPSPFSFSSKLDQQVAALPAAALSPLSAEWRSLNLDMEKTADFLLSSIP